MIGRSGTLLEVTDLVKHFSIRSRSLFGAAKTVQAVDGVSFSLGWNETLGIVGESGCGKTTLARTLLRLETPNSGRVSFDGCDIFSAEARRDRSLNRRIQVVFQDPFAALNPRMSVEEILSEPLRLHPQVLPKEKWAERVRSLIERVGLRPEFAQRYPHEFSGGQLQRIGIARALVLDPDLVILDEPVSALDVSIQAQVINLLQEVQREFGVAFICISHDLSVVHHISDTVAVMYLGNLVEHGNCEAVYGAPGHPYTRALLSAETKISSAGGKKKRILLRGDVPSPVNPPSGCRFRTRCWMAAEKCCEIPPMIENMATGQRVKCHFPLWEHPESAEGPSETQETV